MLDCTTKATASKKAIKALSNYFNNYSKSRVVVSNKNFC